MEFWLWAAIGILAGVVLALLIKLFLMRKTAREIEAEFARRLTADTNTLISISYQDKTMRRLAESINRELRSLRRERRRFQRGDLELKEAVTNISHDLRTPLTAICGYLDLLEQEEKSQNVQRYLSQIEDRTRALRQLTEELFCYSVLSCAQEDSIEKVDLCRFLEESLLSFYGAMRQKGIHPEIEMPEEKVERMLSPSAVSRVFGNILSNALKYSDGDLRVVMDTNGTVTFSNSCKTMDPVTVGRLFDRFYTVETAHNSTGLGLSIARLLTERMGGSIKAHYQGGRLTITVSFP